MDLRYTEVDNTPEAYKKPMHPFLRIAMLFICPLILAHLVMFLIWLLGLNTTVTFWFVYLTTLYVGVVSK